MVAITTTAVERGASAPRAISAYLVRSAIVASLCGLLFGFETAVISGTTDWLKTHFELSNSMLGLTVATALIGSIVGAFAVAKPTDAAGRRGVLFGLALMFTAAESSRGLRFYRPNRLQNPESVPDGNIGYIHFSDDRECVGLDQ